MVIKPCPDTCTFDWVKFHNDLDIALSHMIENADMDTPAREYLPSQAPIMELMKYSDTQRHHQGYVSPEEAARNYADTVEPYDHDR